MVAYCRLVLLLSEGIVEVRVLDGARIHVLEKKQKGRQRRLREDVADVVQTVIMQGFLMGL